MKKAILIIQLLCVLTIVGANAQSKFYIYANIGYSMPAIAQPNGYKLNSHNLSSSYSSSIETIYSSLGSGLNTGICVGYIVNEFMAFEIGGNFIYSPNKLQSISTNYDNNLLELKTESTIGSYNINIFPGVRFFKTYNSFEPFVRIAPLFGITRVTLNTNRTDYTNPNTTNISEQSIVLSGSLAYGLFASTGIKKQLGNHFAISLELFTNLQYYIPRRGRITKSVFNGVDKLPDMTKSAKEIEFVEKDTFNSEIKPNDDEPQKMPFMKDLTFLMNGIGLQIGLHFSF